MNINDRINNNPAILLFEPRPAEAPPNWIVWNAPRPLSGTLCEAGGGGLNWEGHYITGCFYAAVNPDDDLADLWIQCNQDMNARILLYADERLARPLLEMVCCDEGPDVLSAIQSMSASRIVSELTVRLHDQPYGDICNLLAATEAAKQVAA